MTKEAMQMALEALEENREEVAAKNRNSYMIFHYDPAIAALRDALAQQEPCKYGNTPSTCTSSPMDCQCAIDAALAQPAQQPTIEVVCKHCCGRTMHSGNVCYSCTQATGGTP